MKLRNFLPLLLLSAPLLAHSQVDVSASVYGQFSAMTYGAGTAESPDASAGFLLGVRRYKKPWVGYEVTYSYNAANYNFTTGSTSQPSTHVPSNASTATVDYVVSLPVPITGLRPFALAGGGITFFNPQGAFQSETKPVFCYGVGLDYRFLPHIGLRAQYRGLVYQAPGFGVSSTTTVSTVTTEPSIGIFVHF
jgi:opacity protein-like surface antigen